MDITTIIKKLDLSVTKIGYLYVFNKTGLYEYALEKGNTAVNLLLEATSAQVASIRAKIAVISAKLKEYKQYIPTPWLPYAEAVNAALLAVYDATEDGKVTMLEGKECCEKFQLAYSAFMAD